MKAIKTTYLRSNTKEVLDQVAGGETFIIARPANQNAVILSEETYNDMVEAGALESVQRIARKASRRAALADSPKARWIDQEDALERLGL